MCYSMPWIWETHISIVTIKGNLIVILPLIVNVVLQKSNWNGIRVSLLGLN